MDVSMAHDLVTGTTPTSSSGSSRLGLAFMATSDMPLADAGELITRWVAGWAAARGYSTTPDALGTVAVHVGDPHREVDHVALTESAADHDALLSRTVPGHWVTMPTRDRAGTERAARAAGWHVRDPEWLMTCALAGHPRAGAPGGYDVVSTVTGGGVVVVEVMAAGEVAAKGQLAVVGSDAVADRIFTMPAHRRRGLGRLVMETLVDAARELDASTGLLIASVDGRALYTPLGWEVVADIVCAQPAGEPSPGTEVRAPEPDPLE